MELIAAWMTNLLYLLYLLIAVLVSAAVARWILRINDIVNFLDKAEKHLEDIKHQNRIMIQQQERILDFMNSE